MIGRGFGCVGLCSKESMLATLAMLGCRVGRENPNFFIFAIRVVRFSPNLAAAPFVPPTTQPASSSVGMYQMTDAAFAEARHYCIRNHTVVEDGCSLNGLDSRLVPGRAIELTAVYLDRNIAAILAHRPKTMASAQQRQELAAIIHLCGAGPAKAFARRGFHPIAGERCGDQEDATYLDQINAMTWEFLRMEGSDRK